MANFMRFDSTVRSAFDDNAETFANFQKLLVDSAKHDVQQYSEKDANAKIVERFRAALGIDKDAKPAQVRRAIRANQSLVFALIEDTVVEMIRTGWDANPFFMEYVDRRQIDLGDENDFYVEDDSILSVSKVSGNHHNIFLTISVRTE